MESFFHELKSSVRSVSMTEGERARVRGSIARHMAMKPAGSGIHMPLWFVTAGRRTLAGALAIVLVMGSTGGLTFASQDSLPTQPLYSVKLATEEVIAFTKSTPQARATYEIKRVEKRFAEVATLAQTGVEISPAESKKITNKIHNHVARVNEETAEIKQTNAASAIETQTELATSIEAHRDALEAVVEAQPETVETVAAVLAFAEKELSASETATQVAIALSVDQATQTSTQGDLAADIARQADEAAARIASLRAEIEVTTPAGIVPIPEVKREVPAPEPIEIPNATNDEKPADTESVSIITRMQAKEASLMTASKIEIDTTIEPLSSEVKPEEPKLEVVPEPVKTEATTPTNPQLIFVSELETLLSQVRAAIAANHYEEALTILQSIDQKITLQSKLQSVQETLQVDLPTSVIDVPIEAGDAEAKAEAADAVATEEDERDVSAASVSDSIDSTPR